VTKIETQWFLGDTFLLLFRTEGHAEARMSAGLAKDPLNGAQSGQLARL
jgi:hypothetical protein